MSQREKMAVAVSDACAPILAICWPVRFQTQFVTQRIFVLTKKRE